VNYATILILILLCSILENKLVLNKLKSMGAITDYQISQLQQLLPAAQQHQQQQQATSSMTVTPVSSNSLLGVPPPGGMVPVSQHPPFIDLAQSGGGKSNGPSGAMLDLSSVPWGAQAAAAAAAAAAATGAPLHFGAPLANLHHRKSPPEDGERAETDEDVQIVEDRSWRSSRSSGRRRSRSRSRDRKRGRGRSRSRSRDRDSRRRRRSRSRSREGRSGRDRMTDEERQHQRDREKKGLPPIRKGHLSGKLLTTCIQTEIGFFFT